MVRGERDPIRGERTLPIEELLAIVEPIQGVLLAVVGREAELAEAGDAQTSALAGSTDSGARRRR